MHSLLDHLRHTSAAVMSLPGRVLAGSYVGHASGRETVGQSEPGRWEVPALLRTLREKTLASSSSYALDVATLPDDHPLLSTRCLLAQIEKHGNDLGRIYCKRTDEG
jgi:hypothetical protein